MSRPQLLVDATQYASWPAKSGIQRVLLHLATRWSGARVDAHFGFIDGSTYVTGPIAALGALIRSGFDSGGQLSAAEARQALHGRSDASIEIHDLDHAFDGYLLPEPTLRRESLAVAERLRGSRRTRSFFIYYDAIPLTNPEFFPKGADLDGSVTRYHQIVSTMSDIAFISAATREVFERRISRHRLENSIVARLGADGLPSVSTAWHGEPVFAIVGTVEPRKRHHVVLEAFERLWEAGWACRLVVVGAPGWRQSELLDRLSELSTTRLLDWLQDPSDETVAKAVGESCAVLFVPSVEGSGLPALEALALGCPVIVPANLPALDGLATAGQLRLEEVTAETVANAVKTLAEPATNEGHRLAVRGLHLPTWAAFAADVEKWIADSLEGAR